MDINDKSLDQKAGTFFKYYVHAVKRQFFYSPVEELPTEAEVLPAEPDAGLVKASLRMLIACSLQAFMHLPQRIHSIEFGSAEGSISIGHMRLHLPQEMQEAVSVS